MNRFSVASLPGHQLVLHPLLPVWNVCQDLCVWVERLPVVQEQHLWWVSHSSVVGKTAAPVCVSAVKWSLHFGTANVPNTTGVKYTITSICVDDGTKFLYWSLSWYDFIQSASDMMQYHTVCPSLDIPCVRWSHIDPNQAYDGDMDQCFSFALR